MTGALLPSDPSSLAGYRLLGRLGAGGMGVVYLGRTDEGALAAIKVIQAEYAEDPQFRVRFRREAEAARRVGSPWVVPVTGADPDAAAPWLATAFVPGPSLAEAVAECGPLPARSVRVLARMLAGALAEVHTAGLVHRDVKPGNVLLAVDGPRLIDFGIARAADDTAITSADMVVGTPGFLSPEQAEARAGELGPPSDVFSLGCLLAYAATGRPPFGTGAVDALLYRTVHDEPDLEGVDERLSGLLRPCLAKNPADRPTAAALRELIVEDTPGDPAGWLPEDVVRIIAERSAAMLALPDIEPTLAEAGSGTAGSAAGTAGSGAEADTAGAGPAPGRRRFLIAAASGAVLAAGGAAAVWAALRGDDDRTTSSPPSGRDWIIGVQADLSGPGKALGRAQERGARLAVEQFNARADRPFTLTLKVADDRGDVTRAGTVARAFVEDRDVLAVLGPTSDEPARAVVGVYDGALLPLVSVSAGTSLLTTTENRSFLHARPNDLEATGPIAVFLTAGGKAVGGEYASGTAATGPSRRPGLLMDRTAADYAWASVGSVNLLVRGRGRVPYPRVVPAGTRAFGPVVADMLAAGADAFVYGGYAAGAAAFARALAAAGFDGPRYSPEAALSTEFLDAAGEAAEGWLITGTCVDATGLPSAAGFTAAHRKRFGSAPGFYAAEAYDVVNMIADVLRTADGRPTRARLTAALRRTTHQGVTKKFAFVPETGSFVAPEGGAVFGYLVADGRFRFLGPAPVPSSDA
ncbi:bifunctional serine/threonine-protein kinase/ABC transporter substrate-binding protein [Streptomyces sp. NBC_00582]|uniref:bifunctional serine/threonine-protein kinase/ABC transporter substrate-binding protein n=1 Tax=Streptomyces sp. NBC_00582 TaxID=2975783 RepID=UPI002E8090AB|nr:bifunctional serine/threonine-protein kinase/ABC transporter substrate-binding protein [Streptomyces sp. NBC_00582]WUB63751.1 bifunctional serine/threonine-protein kinase/ABC transporter substrate-binding protein [Streptomyces sp. NBC_00582]